MYSEFDSIAFDDGLEGGGRDGPSPENVVVAQNLIELLLLFVE